MHFDFILFQTLPDDVKKVVGKVVGVQSDTIILKTELSTDSYSVSGTVTNVSSFMLEMCSCTVVNMKVMDIVKIEKSGKENIIEYW